MKCDEAYVDTFVHVGGGIRHKYESNIHTVCMILYYSTMFIPTFDSIRHTIETSNAVYQTFPLIGSVAHSNPLTRMINIKMVTIFGTQSNSIIC